ncbi:hypothetical protein AG1IA_09180 [Rhizoctonia solani AG-1 IA]|uniref:Uncharacterized protein n=1 Tax=Thanatephorus cucumeris (strain AG1-IA) TaxID=983506 RepID=L8WFS7_THACA|nr:hypothetical protein AG1IA_09180 [Rhizoctonia solani AG-1 IA]
MPDNKMKKYADSRLERSFGGHILISHVHKMLTVPNYRACLSIFFAQSSQSNKSPPMLQEQTYPIFRRSGDIVAIIQAVLPVYWQHNYEGTCADRSKHRLDYRPSNHQYNSPHPISASTSMHFECPYSRLQQVDSVEHTRRLVCFGWLFNATVNKAGLHS